MNKKPTFLAIIPARGGSKRLPRKNILDLNGKPLIAYSIEASQKSKYITKTIVTSDDDEILNVASKYGCDTIKRPSELSSDTSTSFDAIEHTIINQKESYDYIVLLQPTSPLRTSKHVDEAIELLFEKKGNAVISICEVEHPVQWNMKLGNDLDMSNFVKKINISRSQDQDKHYRLNGAIYISNSNMLLNEKTFFLEKNIFSFIMDRKDSIDIDEKLDFIFAQVLLKSNC